MIFLRLALDNYKKNSYKKRKILKRTAVNYYYLSKLNVLGLWGGLYNDSPYGNKLYEAITQHVIGSSSRCVYCQDKIFHNKNLNVDHVLPSSIYPQYTFSKENLVVACVTCNMLKKDDDYYGLLGAGKYYPDPKYPWSCFHPRHHKYSEHIDRFIVQTNYLHIRAYLGITAEGVALCEKLLNNVSEFEIKATANPNVANAIENLGGYLAQFPTEKTQALKGFIISMAHNI